MIRDIVNNSIINNICTVNGENMLIVADGGEPGRPAGVEPGPNCVWFFTHFVVLEIQNVVLEMRRCG